MEHYCISEDLLMAEILSRLPLKSILICRCVSKSWYALTRSRNFISNHLSKIREETLNPKFLLHLNYTNGARYSNEIKFYHEDGSSFLLYLPTNPDYMFFALTSSNGIICLVDRRYKYKFILTNPYIKRSICIPFPKFKVLISRPTLLLMGSTFDYRNHDHIILRITHRDDVWTFQIYSLNSNCWMDIIPPSLPDCNFVYRHTDGAFLNGRFHWVVRDANENFILVFDLKYETFHKISLPKCLAAPNFGPEQLIVSCFKGSIVVIHCPHEEDFVWVMKEYGAVDSWKPTPSSQIVPPSLAKCRRIYLDDKVKLDGYHAVPTVHEYIPSLLLLDKKVVADPPSNLYRVLESGPYYEPEGPTLPGGHHGGVRHASTQLNTPPTRQKRVRLI